jgi:hypothetical protein
MTKTEAIALFGSPEELRKALGLKTRHAVYMWDDDKPIPEAHELKIRHVLKPEAFPKASTRKRVA